MDTEPEASFPLCHNATPRSYRFIFNNDGTNILGNRLHGGRPLIPQDVFDYVDLLAGSPITSFFICPNSSMPYYDSDVERAIGCASGEPTANSGPWPHPNENCEIYGRSICSLLEHGTNLVALCVQRARELGMEAFVTMRMNDLHHHNTQVRQPLAQGDFWLSHPEYRVGPHPGWHADGALDFAQEPVRRYKLALVEELCRRFDIDGLELDFMRFPVNFPFGTGEAHTETMTAFVREVRAIARREGERRGRPLLLTARVPSSLAHCRWTGLDPAAWAREGLLDFLTASCVFHDFPLPLAEFRAALGGTFRLPLYAAIENGIGRASGREFRSHAMYRAAAAHLHAEGADGIYLFNFFLTHRAPEVLRGDEPPGSIRFGDDFRAVIEQTHIGPDRSLLDEMGAPQALAGRSKHYALPVKYEENRGFDYPPYLPRTLDADGVAEATVVVPDDVAAFPPLAMVLATRTSGGVPSAVSLNGLPLEQLPGDAPEAAFCHEGPCAGRTAEMPPLVRWRVPVGSLRQGANAVRVVGVAGAILAQVDLLVMYPEKEPLIQGNTSGTTKTT